MTTWHCAAEIATARDTDSTPVECGVPRAVGVVDCPECGTSRAPFRENGEGEIFDLVDVTGLDREPGTEFVPALRNVRESDQSGTNEGNRTDGG